MKHACADMLVAVESARSAAYYAGWAASADDAELRIAAPLAKAYCADAYYSVAAETIQVHGGIGFTWEHDAHLYFKRAKTDPADARRLGDVAGRAGRPNRPVRTPLPHEGVAKGLTGDLLHVLLERGDVELAGRSAHDIALAVDEHVVGERTATV